MAKTYTDELAEWVKKREIKGREKNLVAFLGLRDDVKAAIEAGYSAKTIWSNMRECGRIGFGYEAFLSYVNRLIKKGRDTKPGRQSGASLVVGGTTPTTVEPPHSSAVSSQPATSTKRAGMPTFKFNPVPSNREE